MPHESGMIPGLVGGVGLVLLGMRLMTDGLRVAAGEALRSILGTWTRTTLRGFLSGALITSLVQSSGAVTVATLGFVNAGVLTLSQAIGVVYGSNLGTTMTGWLVALVGFEFDIQRLALPAIGLGMGLRLTGEGRRRAALGESIAGLGLFFLGLDVLRSSTAGIEQELSLAGSVAGSPGDIAFFVLAGFVLTSLMQSSSAALAIGLTSAASGVLPLISGAALVIGTNVGSTTTSLLAALSATPSARRVAAAHVMFNLVSASVSLLLLPYLLAGVVAVRSWVTGSEGAAATLALFHTAQNLLGVLLLWPLTPRLVRFLERRFRSAAEEARRPRHLDRTVLGTPALAIDALALELDRLRRRARQMARGCLGETRATAVEIHTDGESLRALAAALGEFTREVRQQSLPEDLAAVLPQALRGSQYFLEVAELAAEIASEPRSGSAGAALSASVSRFREVASGLVEKSRPTASPEVAEENAATAQELLAAYESAKDRLLQEGTEGRLPLEPMVLHLEDLSRCRRLVEQFRKGVACTAELLAVSTRKERGSPEA